MVGEYVLCTCAGEVLLCIGRVDFADVPVEEHDDEYERGVTGKHGDECGGCLCFFHLFMQY